ncbi:MAG: malonyl-ACP O-methyltransferase BioC [Acinetobacter sp.]
MKNTQIAQRFAQAQQSYDQHAVAQRHVAQQLFHLMQQHLPQPHLQRALEIGCGSGLFSQIFLQHYGVDQLFLNDLYPEVKQHFPESEQFIWGIGDIEQLPLPHSLDLVVSCSALQWIQDLPVLTQKVATALNASGFFCFASYAEDNLKEIKALTGQGLDYLALETVVNVLQVQGFDIIVANEERIQLNFAQPRDVLKHMKATGVQATAQGFRWSKKSLAKFEDDYAQFQKPGTEFYPLTYHPIYLIARKAQ